MIGESMRETLERVLRDDFYELRGLIWPGQKPHPEPALAPVEFGRDLLLAYREPKPTDFASTAETFRTGVIG